MRSLRQTSIRRPTTNPETVPLRRCIGSRDAVVLRLAARDMPPVGHACTPIGPPDLPVTPLTLSSPVGGATLAVIPHRA